MCYLKMRGSRGPTQVEDDINKKTGDQQRGWQAANDVIRGNLLILPIEDALFYLEAIYLQAKKPEVKMEMMTSRGVRS